jgi:hypothetical protein
MRNFITLCIITVCSITLNYFLPISVVSNRANLNMSLFNAIGEPEMDSTVVILNIGNLKDSEIIEKIDSIILQKPKSIGLDLCNLSKDSLLQTRYQRKPEVTILDCSDDSESGSSLISDDIDASRFKTDNPNYFEIRLSDSWNRLQERGNKSELINYKGVSNRFVTVDLKDAKSISLRNRIVLISYLAETIPPDAFDADLLKTGLYQIQYSAFIISTIVNDDFINESNFIIDFLLIVAAVLLIHGLLTIMPVKNAILLTIISFTLIGLINAGVTGLVLILFTKGYYLHTNGLSGILVIATLYTCMTKFENNNGRAKEMQ